MDPRLRARIQPKPSALAFDLVAGCTAFLADLPKDVPLTSYPETSFRIVQQWAAGQGTSAMAASQLLEALSELSLVPQLTASIAIHFRPLLVDLTARLLPGPGASWYDVRVKATYCALCKLVPVTPEVAP